MRLIPDPRYGDTTRIQFTSGGFAWCQHQWDTASIYISGGYLVSVLLAIPLADFPAAIEFAQFRRKKERRVVDGSGP